MKQTLSILLITAILTSCGTSTGNNTVSDAKQVAAGIISMQPGGIATTAGGWTMTAKINGKSWSANSIVSPDMAGRIVGESNGETISLPYDRRGMVVGKTTKFSHNNAVDLFTNDEVALWGGYAGEMEITKVDADWAEGKFIVTGSTSSTDKTLEVTEGFFRISMVPQK